MTESARSAESAPSTQARGGTPGAALTQPSGGGEQPQRPLLWPAPRVRLGWSCVSAGGRNVSAGGGRKVSAGWNESAGDTSVENTVSAGRVSVDKPTSLGGGVVGDGQFLQGRRTDCRTPIGSAGLRIRLVPPAAETRSIAVTTCGQPISAGKPPSPDAGSTNTAVRNSDTGLTLIAAVDSAAVPPVASLSTTLVKSAEPSNTAETVSFGGSDSVVVSTTRPRRSRNSTLTLRGSPSPSTKLVWTRTDSFAARRRSEKSARQVTVSSWACARPVRTKPPTSTPRAIANVPRVIHRRLRGFT